MSLDTKLAVPPPAAIPGVPLPQLDLTSRIHHFNHLREWTLHSQILAVRHGHAESNQKGILVGNPHDVDLFPLTSTGIAQARERGADLRTQRGLGRETVICCSEFLRARQTAEIIADELGASSGSIKVLPELNERFPGRYDRGDGPCFEREVWARELDNPFSATHGVESSAAVLDRVTQIVLALDRRFPHDKIVLVSHLDPLRILHCGLLDLHSGRHSTLPAIPNGGILEVTAINRTQRASP